MGSRQENARSEPRGEKSDETGADPLAGERPVSDFDLDFDLGDDDDDFDDGDDSYPEIEMEIGLPLRGENYVTGEPLVTVDYFCFAAARRAVVAERLLGLDHALADEGAEQPRILLFEGPCADETFNVLDLIAILTVREADVRVETARGDVVDVVRRAVASALGADARHLRRTTENPVQEYLQR